MSEPNRTVPQADSQTRELLAASLRGKGTHMSLEAAVESFPDELMNTAPPNVPYTFWGQLEHMRIAQEDLYAYATKPGNRSPEWPGGYWPDPAASADRSAWDATIEGYLHDRERFVELVLDPACELFAPINYMEGRSIFRTVLYTIDHTSYHLGEFVMGRQTLGYWKSDLAGNV